MDDDLHRGVPEGPPLEVAEVLALGPPLEVVMGPMMEEAARMELELGSEVGQWVNAWWGQLLVANSGKDL